MVGLMRDRSRIDPWLSLQMRGEIEMPQNEPGIDEEFMAEFTMHTQKKDVCNRCNKPVDTQPEKDHYTHNNEIRAAFPFLEKLVA